MSVEPPPPNPPILNYKPPEPAKNSVGKFIARVCLGACLGFGGMVLSLGLWIAETSYKPYYVRPFMWLILLMPPTVALAVAVKIGLAQRKYGYVTGVLLAPFFLAVGLFLLLLAICGRMGSFR